MAHSPSYQIRQKRRPDTAQHPLSTMLLTEPSPIATVIVASNLSSNIHTTSLPSSHRTHPRSAPSLSESSTVTYPQPTALIRDASRDTTSTDFPTPGSIQGYREHRQAKADEYTVEDIRSQDELSPARYPHRLPVGHTTMTYTPDDYLCEDVETRKHALWVLVSKSSPV